MNFIPGFSNDGVVGGWKLWCAPMLAGEMWASSQRGATPRLCAAPASQGPCSQVEKHLPAHQSAASDPDLFQSPPPTHMPEASSHSTFIFEDNWNLFFNYWFFRKRGTSICCFTYLCIHWLILICALTRDQTYITLAYQDNALTNWAT